MFIKVLCVLLPLIMILPVVIFNIGEKKPARFKKYLAVNIISFFAVLIFTTLFMFSGRVFAAEAAVDSSAAGMAYIAAALVTGMCCIGAGLATGPAAAAALGALSENESIMGKALIFVSLAEGISIFGIIIAFTILGRV